MAKPKAKRPKRPKDSPISPHASGSWTGYVGGKCHYLAPWSDYAGALTKFKKLKAMHELGLDPDSLTDDKPVIADSPTVKEIAGKYLKARGADVKRGLLSRSTLRHSEGRINNFVEQYGRIRVKSLTPKKWTKMFQDLPSDWAVNTANSHIKKIRQMFDYASDSGWIAEKMNYGMFKPIRATKRTAKAKVLYSPEEIHKVLQESPDSLKCCILLTLSTGMGSSDLASLRKSDIVDGWIVGQRAKTGEQRIAPVWKEVQELIDKLEPDETGCFLHTASGLPIADILKPSRYTDNFADACDRAGVESRGPYLMRSITQSVCERANTPLASLATSRIMGHVRREMGDRYRAMDCPRWQIRKCSDYLHAWLYKSEVWSEVEHIRNDMHSDDEAYYHAMQEVLNAMLKDHPELA